MPSTTLTVFQKILEMFLMASAGYFCGKKGLVSEGGTKELNSILFYVVTPVITIYSFQDSIGLITAADLTTTLLISILAMGLGVALSYCFFRKTAPAQQRVLRFAAIYPNSGFIGLPLAQAMFGSRGVVYAVVFGISYSLFVWTHGIGIMRGTSRPNWKSAFLNPGIVGLAIGLPLFAFSFRLPEVVYSPLGAISGLNTPLAMIVLGSYISRIPLRKTFQNPLLYASCAIRLLLIPAVFYLVMLLLPVRPDATVFSTVMILASAPAAVNTVMFTAQFDGDVELGSQAVALCTLLSILTVPLFAALPAGGFSFFQM